MHTSTRLFTTPSSINTNNYNVPPNRIRNVNRQSLEEQHTTTIGILKDICEERYFQYRCAVQNLDEKGVKLLHVDAEFRQQEISDFLQAKQDKQEAEKNLSKAIKDLNIYKEKLESLIPNKGLFS